MRVISLTNASSVPDPETGEQYEPGADGVFDLPEPFGLHLTTKHASVWRGEAQHQAAQRAAAVEELRNPNVVAAAVAELRERVERLTAQVAEHEARLTAKRARPGKAAAEAPDTGESTSTEDEQTESGLDTDTGNGDDGETRDSAASVEEPGTEDAPTPEAKAAQARKTAAKKTAARKPPAD